VAGILAVETCQILHLFGPWPTEILLRLVGVIGAVGREGNGFLPCRTRGETALNPLFRELVTFRYVYTSTDSYPLKPEGHAQRLRVL
jgi:hypothetical protein